MYDILGSWAKPHLEFIGTAASPFGARAAQSDRPDPRQNRLLAALPETVYREILPELEGVSLPLGLALREAGGPQRYVYFPTTSIVAMLYVLENGDSTECAVTGNDGMVGTPLVMGGETTPSRAVVVSAGHAYRIGGAVLKKQFERGGTLQHLLLRYIQALIVQTAQTAACNRHHTIDQQLCRWLLLSLDRMRSNRLTMTHDLIASMLGVRREGVTEAAGRLQARGIIQCRRGHISVLDRSKLEASVCECYAVVKREYDRLIPAETAVRAPMARSERTSPPLGLQSPGLSAPHHHRQHGTLRTCDSGQALEADRAAAVPI